jgi:AraC-like DNA-binding protein
MSDALTNCANRTILKSVSSGIHRVSPVANEEFVGHSHQWVPLANLKLLCIESAPFTVLRFDEHIADDSVFDFFIHTQLEGSAEIVQGEAEFTLEPGELAVVAGGTPYSIKYTQKGSRLILRVPHQIFHERVLGRQICEFGARIYTGGGLSQILIDLLASLSTEADKLSEIEQYTVAESLLELIGSVFRSQNGLDGENQGCAQAARMCRILSFLEENYSDHELTPAKVASANAVSVRHLHNLFRQSGMTVCKWIWSRRLKSAREDLTDPFMSGKSISDIAYGKGFNDSAHFSRAFKGRFGISPSAMRNMMREQQERRAS